jgi:NAD+ kinase
MRRVGVLVHPTRPVQDALELLRRWTEDRGLELVQVPVGEQPKVAPPGEVSACDLIAALGGDGTVLKALHAAAGSRTPVMGVAYGSLGALTTISHDQLPSALDSFAAGDWIARDLPALRVAIAEDRTAWAVNDLVLSRTGSTQLVVDVHVGDELYVRIAGDGVVVATALGSSAYSMAAGGPLLGVGTKAFVCTPLAMHGGCAPPLVVEGEQQVTLEAHPGHTGFELVIDGFEIQDAAGRRFLVDYEPAYTTLVGVGDRRDALAGLRRRGLIADSPRVVARDDRTLHAEAGTASR